MAKSNLDILRDFGAIADELKNKRMSPEYWEKESKLINEMIERADKERRMIQMSPEKFRKPFDL